MGVIAELRRRNVFRVGTAYLVLSWLLIQVAAVMLPAFEAPGWVMRVLVLVLAAGFVAALVFSWVFELTPEGLKREHEVDRDASISRMTARKLDLAVIVLLVAAIGVSVWSARRAPGESRSAGTAATPAAPAVPSLAVLPFVNVSAVAENEYFSDGLTETLLNMLAQVEGLKVTARTSAFAFKGQNKDVREIAATLNVNAVLEGSVQRAGDRVRITAQLIDARDGNHLWSQSYDRKLDDLFAIQDEIAGAVARELTQQLLGGKDAPRVAPVGTHDSDAYDAYLRGLEQLNLSSFASLPQAERRFREALQRDAAFSDARIALARTYLDMSDTGLLNVSEAAQRGRSVLAPLLEGATPDPRAQAYDATLQWNADPAAISDRAKFKATLDAALARAPGESTLYQLAARAHGEEPEALALLERGLALDPLSIDLLHARARELRDLGKVEAALAEYARIRELAPASVIGYNGAALVHAENGRYVDAVYWYSRCMALDPDDHELPANAAQSLLVMGLAAEALPWIRRAELLNASGSDTRRVLIQHAEQTGDRERAIALSREVLTERRDNRRWVHGIAALHYTYLMADAGRADEALALFEQVSPGSTALPLPAPKTEFDFDIQGIAATLLARRETIDQRRQRAAHLRSLFKRVSRNYDSEIEHDIVGAYLAALEGDRATATRVLANTMNDPAERPPEWRLTVLRDPLLGEYAREPAVAAAIAAFEKDLAQQAERYRKLVADGEIKVP